MGLPSCPGKRHAPVTWDGSVYLKRITLHGFKSFADRTEFEFGSGRTGIVGPNGCGKSNVLDAVRWVLGEQSAKTLRGAKMLDVVFAGSRTRKPATFAEVQLTFDNTCHTLASDEPEVTVGRTLYASGESEYRINGNACRLRDIRELFLDTGIGLDAYSVIEQGKVDALLQASPQQRREIFEEAAGISRYRVRRAEAARKLERTQNNLLRLHDVIEELERRLRSVKLAAGKARSFKEYDARLRELRCSFSLAEYHKLQAARRSNQARASALGDVLGAKRVELARFDAAASELAHELQSFDERVQAVTATLSGLQGETAALAERIVQEQRRAAEFAEARDRHATEAVSADQQAEQLARQLASQEDALLALRSAEHAQAGVVAGLRQARADAEAQREAVRGRWRQESAAVAEIEQEIARADQQAGFCRQELERLAQRRAQLAQRRVELEADVAGAQRRHAALEEASTTGEERRRSLAVAVEQADAQILALQRQLSERSGQVAAVKEDRSALLSRLGVLEELDERHEGVDAAVRAILAWPEERRVAAGVVGLVGDLLRIDDPRAATIQAVLARFENLLVVREMSRFVQVAREMGEPAGPVGVLGLDRLPAPSRERTFRSAISFVAYAADWVSCDEAHRDLAEHLLGRTVVVESVAHALLLAAGGATWHEFASLDGCAVSSDGRLVLGSNRGAAGLIRRQAEIRQLQAQRDEVETSLERLVRACAAAEQRLDDVQTQRGALLDESAALQRDALERQSQMARLTDSLSAGRRELAGLDRDQAEAERTGEGVERQLAALVQQREQLARRCEEQRGRIAACEQELARAEQDAARVSERLTEALVEAGRTGERRTAAEEAMNRLREQVVARQAAGRQAERLAADAQERIAVAREQQQGCQARRAALSERIAVAEGEAGRLRAARVSCRARLERCNGVLRALHREIEEVEQVLRDRELALRESEVRCENLVTRTSEELGLSLVELYAGYQHSERDWEAVRDEIESLREKIARLGNVNLDSLAELEELTPRYDALVAQRADLQDSMARLERLIGELDEESRARFAASFEEIRGHFQELFRKVFGGGKADIVLEDPAGALECGIEIIARPPGKEPQALSLLSGGEKTMAAIALLLAVFKSKPSPFAFLDEVDAALDEANLDRFNMVVDEFTAESQFIVITHNKRTMQRSDVLYGVTMEEPGVSKRVSVRLEDRVETPVGA